MKIVLNSQGIFFCFDLGKEIKFSPPLPKIEGVILVYDRFSFFLLKHFIKKIIGT